MVRALGYSRDDAQALLAYDREVFERYARRVRRLSWKQATRARGIGHESLFHTLVHILNVHEVWLAYIVRGRNRDRDLEPLFEDPTRHPTNWKEFTAYARKVWAEVDATAAGLTPTMLARRVSVFWMPGRYTVRDALLQTTFEEAHHIGEIIGALWQEDRKPPEMTWIDVGRQLAGRRSRRRR